MIWLIHDIHWLINVAGPWHSLVDENVAELWYKLVYTV